MFRKHQVAGSNPVGSSNKINNKEHPFLILSVHLSGEPLIKNRHLYSPVSSDSESSRYFTRATHEIDGVFVFDSQQFLYFRRCVETKLRGFLSGSLFYFVRTSRHVEFHTLLCDSLICQCAFQSGVLCRECSHVG